MCGLVCFGLGVKFHFLGIKAAKLCVLSVYFALSSAKCEGSSKESGGSDRPDIHQTALLPFKLSRKKKNQGGKKHNSQNKGRPD